ncbi:hypothetical protein R6Q57_009513 [Mikania cordata]
MYKAQQMLFTRRISSLKETNSWQSYNSTNNMEVIEFVTSPNNPNGELKKSVNGAKTTG